MFTDLREMIGGGVGNRRDSPMHGLDIYMHNAKVTYLLTMLMRNGVRGMIKNMMLVS